MALTFIGKPISLISHSDVRYRGILAGIDPAASTIQLSNVYSMGTETRRPPESYIAPVQDPYQYIIFRASEVKDLSVDDPTQAAPRRTAHDDPAVLAASQPMPYNPYNAQPAFSQGSGPPGGVPQQQPQASYPTRQPNGPPQGQSSRNAVSPQAPQNGRRNAAVNSATASMETVERALGDLRVNGGGAQRGGRRGGGRDIKAGDMRVPATDFDFQGSNARFDKTAVAPKLARNVQADEDKDTSDDDTEEKEKEKEEEDIAYNPKKSFFDQLSSSAAHPPPHGGGRGRGRGGRSRREEEREKNVATFGEPGGVGLMGAHAYVGGYGRRGGRPRRGGPPPVAGR